MAMDRALSHWWAELRHERMVLGGSMWNFQRKWLFLPLALSLWLSAASASQAKGMYQISESELTTLEQDLHQLAKNSESKQQLLIEQKAQLTKASQQWM